MSELDTADREHGEWELLVGRAILFFGEIELISIKCLAHIPTERISETASRLNFASRVDLLLEILAARPDKSAALQGLADGFRRAKDLAKTRNLIAHNPVLLEVYVNDTKGDSIGERSISSVRGGATLFKLDDLKEFATAVEDLASLLWMHYLRALGNTDSLFNQMMKPDA